MDSYIYVNGSLVGNYPFGYNTFTYDLTEYLYYGENTIAVKVTNMQRFIKMVFRFGNL